MAPTFFGEPGCHVHQRLLIAALHEGQFVTELLECLTQTGHIAMPKNAHRRRNEALLHSIHFGVLICNKFHYLLSFRHANGLVTTLPLLYFYISILTCTVPRLS